MSVSHTLSFALIFDASLSLPGVLYCIICQVKNGFSAAQWYVRIKVTLIKILVILVWGLRPEPVLMWGLWVVVGVIPLKNGVGVQYIGGGLIFDVGVHTPVRTMGFL